MAKQAANTRLAEAVDEKFESRADFAHQLRVHESQVRRWINRGQRPGRLQRQAIARRLGVKPGELWP